MRSNCIERALLAIAAVVGLAVSPFAAAQTYPERAVRIVLPYPPGGGADVVARLVAAQLSQRLKQSFVVDNKPGATGTIGTAYVARAQPDGYTLLFVHADTLGLGPQVLKNVGYDALKDFSPLGWVGESPFALFTGPSLKTASLNDFIAQAKKAPGKFTYATPGVGSSRHVGMEMFASAAGIELMHVPYQGSAPALTSVLGGQVDLMMGSFALVGPLHQAGKVRVLGMASPSRLGTAPDIPTMREQGLALEVADYYGFVGPAGLPRSIVELLNKEINRIALDPGVREKLTREFGMRVIAEPKTPEDFRQKIEKDHAAWGETVRKAHITVE